MSGKVDRKSASSKRSRSTTGSTDQSATDRVQKSRRHAKPPELKTAALHIDDLPSSALECVMRKLGFPHRFTAAKVCRRWRAASMSPVFSRTVQNRDFASTISASSPGDTVCIPPGFYEDLIFVDKPLRLVGQLSSDMWGGQRRGCVFQNSRSVVALCNARCCIQNVVMRTTAPVKIRSVCCYGPKCDMIWLQNCEIGGFAGLSLPASMNSDTKLVLLGCHFHSIPSMPAVMVSKGHLNMQGCTVTNCSAGVMVAGHATALIQNNDISFNQLGLAVENSAIIRDNVIWGNLDAAVDLPEGVPACATCCALVEEDACPEGSHAAPGPPSHRPPALPMPAVGVGTSFNHSLDRCAPIASPCSTGCALHGSSAPLAASAAAGKQAPFDSSQPSADGASGPFAHGDHCAQKVLDYSSKPAGDAGALVVQRNHVRRAPAGFTGLSTSQRDSLRQARRLIDQVYGSDHCNDWQGLMQDWEMDTDDFSDDFSLGESEDYSDDDDDDSLDDDGDFSDDFDDDLPDDDLPDFIGDLPALAHPHAVFGGSSSDDFSDEDDSETEAEHAAEEAWGGAEDPEEAPAAAAEPSAHVQ
ncbi:hypothetical protein WJX73_010069 [Symbiochloris irregularis]|uniref:F-box domain-containing protein n=1 Tax=Symbiochloris irregularis TaxID=706552 RepID=A0AAW1NP73_9CHLO